MSGRVAVIGSGPSGAAAAGQLIEDGWHVDMLDVGHSPDGASLALAERLRRSIDAGTTPTPGDLAALRAPGHDRGLVAGLTAVLGGKVDATAVRKRILGSDHPFTDIERLAPVRGALPPRSLAKGGLSNVWGAACYPLRACDHNDWGISADEFAPFLDSASRHLAVDQCDDALKHIYPLHGPVRDDRPRNPGSAAEAMLANIRAKAPAGGWIAGRSRLAVSVDACTGCGLCFSGCPYGCIHNAAESVAVLEGHSRFSYLPGRLVQRFDETADGVEISGRIVTANTGFTATYDAVVLAAGALGSFSIAARSLAPEREAEVLDNELFVVPIALKDARGEKDFSSAFGLSELVFALPPGDQARHGAHVQVYAFHPYFLGGLGPVLSRIPAGATRLLHRALNRIAIAFIYLDGRQSRRARIRLDGDVLDLSVTHAPDAMATAKTVMGSLAGAVKEWRPIGPLMKHTPFGFSGHLGGTLRLGGDGPLATDRTGRLLGSRRVFAADASTFPIMPPQNPTLVAVANARRVCSGIGR